MWRLIRKACMVCVIGLAAVCLLLLGLPNRYSRDKDSAYLRDVLGGIVLDSMKTRGSLPESFDQAMQVTGKTLSHRGNLYGGPLWYHKSRNDCFFFISAGPNGTLEMGRNDDLVVAWDNGQWLLDVGGEFVDREFEPPET